MNTVEYRFLEPLDVLFLRGNKLFGDPGSFGESLVPPWPSVAAGAMRSRMLVDAGVDPAAFARGEAEHPELGVPDRPGSFAVTAFRLARRRRDDGRVEVLIQPPADLVVSEDEAGQPGVRALAPTDLTRVEGLACSAPLPLLPVLAETERSKPGGGYWLTEAGWKKYLAGSVPAGDAELVKSDALWKLDHRVGVGLDADTRRAADGRLFSMQAVSMIKRGHRVGRDKQTGKPLLADYDVGFIVGVTGAQPPTDGTVRLGGDGRAASMCIAANASPLPDYEAIAKARRCRLVLGTPGLFADGWLPTGATRHEDGSLRFELHGVRGRIACAAVPRAEVVSGWDLAKGEPKAAKRAAPAGSVYWMELDEGVAADTLRKLAESGLWREPCEDAQRRAEGFNRLAMTDWRR